MSDEEKGVSVKELTSTTFGYIIAFILPGLLGLYGLALWFSDINSLLKPALAPDTTVGPSLFLLFCALAIGLFISAARFFIFERWLCKNHKFPQNMFRQLREGGKLACLYSRGRTALPLSSVLWWFRYCHVHPIPRWMNNHWNELGCLKSWGMIILFLIFQTMIIESARDAFIRYVRRGNEMLKVEETKNV